MFRSGSGRSIAPYHDALAKLDSRYLGTLLRFNTEIAGIKLAAMVAYRETCIEELMELFRVPSDVLSDIMTIGDAALDSADSTLALSTGKFLDNPIFAGAPWVGGAIWGNAEVATSCILQCVGSNSVVQGVQGRHAVRLGYGRS